MLEYWGNIEGLKTELDSYREKADGIYRAMLGSKLYRKLEETSARILTPDAFLLPDELIARVRNLSGEETPVRHMYIERSSLRRSNFGILFSVPEGVAISNGGRIRHSGERDICTTPSFTFTEEAFEISSTYPQRSGFPKYITPFIHEYDHYITYVLQRTPMHAAAAIPIDELEKMGYSSDFISDIYRNVMEDAENKADRGAVLALLLNRLADLSETSAVRMDTIMFRELGFPWEKYAESKLSPSNLRQMYQMFMISDDKATASIFNWTNKMRGTNDFLTNFINSLEALKVHRMSLTEYLSSRE